MRKIICKCFNVGISHLFLCTLKISVRALTVLILGQEEQTNVPVPHSIAGSY